MIKTENTGLPQASPPVSLRKNFVWTFIGYLVNSGSLWVLIVILAKNTSPEAVGQFSYALALTTPIMLFASLKLRSAQATDQKNEYSFGDYWSLRLLTSAVALIVIFFIALSSYTDHVKFFTILIIGFAKVIESLSDIFHGLFQKHERMDIISRSMIYRGIITLFISAILLNFISGSIAIATGMFLSWLIIFLIYDIPNAKKLFFGSEFNKNLFFKSSKKNIQNLICLTLPLGASIAIGSLYNNIPRYVIESNLGSHSLGIFSALAYFMIFSGMIFTAVAQTVIPRLASYYSEKNISGFRNILIKLIAVGFFIGLFGVIVTYFFGELFINILYTSEYADHVFLLILLMVANFIDLTFLSIASAINAMRYFRIQVVVSSVSTLFFAPICFFLVKNNGLNGAAIAMIIAKLLEALIYLYIVNKYIKIQFEKSLA